MLVMCISLAGEYAYYIKQSRTKASDETCWRPAPELDGSCPQVMTGVSPATPADRAATASKWPPIFLESSPCATAKTLQAPARSLTERSGLRSSLLLVHPKVNCRAE
jgi:hypothetical protein